MHLWGSPILHLEIGQRQRRIVLGLTGIRGDVDHLGQRQMRTACSLPSQCLGRARGLIDQGALGQNGREDQVLGMG